MTHVFGLRGHGIGWCSNGKRHPRRALRPGAWVALWCSLCEYTGISSLMELIPYIYSVNFEISVCNVFPRYC